MGVYTYPVSGFPVSGVNKNTLTFNSTPNAVIVIPAGVWTAAGFEYDGSTTGGNLDDIIDSLITTQSVLGNGFHDEIWTTNTLNPVSPFAFTNSNLDIAAINSNLETPVTFKWALQSNAAGVFTINNASLILTGVPAPPVGVVFPYHSFNPAFYTFEHFPFGYLPRRTGTPETDAKGNLNMNCLFPKDSTYLTIAGVALPANFPIMQQISHPNVTAQWLKTCPGLYNAGGSPAAMEIRIYRAQTGQAPGRWFASQGVSLGELVWVGQTSYPDLIPWGGDTLEYVVELTGITSIPASSAFDMVIQGFDTQ